MPRGKTFSPFDKLTAQEVADWMGRLKAPRVPAVPVLKAGAGEEEWHAARDAGVGASEIAAIMGISPWGSRYATWWRKALGWRLPSTEAMDDGQAHEAMIAAEFAQRHPELYVTTPVTPLWAHREHSWMLCTPDRLAVAHDTPMILEGAYTVDGAREARQGMHRPSVEADPYIIPVELKWDASPGWGPSGSLIVPEHYELQVMWQAHIFGAPGGWLVRRKPTGRNRYAEYWIPYNPEKIAAAIAAGQSFITSLELGIAPDPDGASATADALRRLYPAPNPEGVAAVKPDLRQAWEAARDLRASVGRVVAELDNRMREALGESAVGMDADSGEVFVRRSVRKRAGYTVAPCEVDELRRTVDGGAGTASGIPAADDGEEADGGAGAEGAKEGNDRGDHPASALEGSPDSAAGEAGGVDEGARTEGDLTPQMLAELTTEAEAGYDVDKLVPRRVGDAVPKPEEVIEFGTIEMVPSPTAEEDAA